MVNVLEAFTVNGDAVVALAPVFATVIGPVAAPDGITTPTDDADWLCSGREIGLPLRPGILT
jgi:hypothetical protein